MLRRVSSVLCDNPMFPVYSPVYFVIPPMFSVLRHDCSMTPPGLSAAGTGVQRVSPEHLSDGDRRTRAQCVLHQVPPGPARRDANSGLGRQYQGTSTQLLSWSRTVLSHRRAYRLNAGG